MEECTSSGRHPWVRFCHTLLPKRQLCTSGRLTRTRVCARVCASAPCVYVCVCRQRVLYSTSTDGKVWTKAAVLFPNMSTTKNPAADFAGPFAVLNGRLYASVSVTQLYPASASASANAADRFTKSLQCVCACVHVPPFVSIPLPLALGAFSRVV